MNIWYVFKKSDGEYMGNGTPFYDDETYGSTLTPCPEYDDETEIPYWNGESWTNMKKE